MPFLSFFQPFYRRVVLWFIEAAWPWISGTLWPIIKDYVIEVIVVLWRRFMELFQERLHRRRQAEEEYVNQHAEDEQTKADNSTDDVERKIHNAKAEVYREVGRYLQEKREEDRKEMEEQFAALKQDIIDEINKREFDDIFEKPTNEGVEVKKTGEFLQIPDEPTKPTD
jgi:hypothetical protein